MSDEAAWKLAADWPIFGPAEAATLKQVVESGHWGHAGGMGYVGRFEPQFERAFADLQTARHGLCVANGTVALQLALEALDVGFGDEVIVPGLTWQATAGAVLDVNAEPVLVDVEPDTYCLDPDAVEAALTPRTKAIIAVHLYGSLADLDRLVEIADRHGLFLIEDCAHSHGSAWRGRGVGSVGSVGCFSFQSSKSLTAGEGGFCSTNSDELASRIAALRTCGRRPAGADESWRPIQSGNYRLSEWEAAILSVQLERFPDQLRVRAENARRLDAAIAAIDGVAPMRAQPQITRRGLYAYVFRLNPAAAGLPAEALRAQLATELGITVGTTYVPLNGSALYQPRTKRRHHLNSSYWERIDPARFELPVAWRAHSDEAVVIPHEVLLNDWSALQRLPAVVENIIGAARARDRTTAKARAS
jgi:L-glutamine:2-deoxy-scyllo-inosose/3-amino-2,3-dideoxy-scyllo-inosose aminotransferase